MIATQFGLNYKEMKNCKPTVRFYRAKCLDLSSLKSDTLKNGSLKSIKSHKVHHIVKTGEKLNSRASIFYSN